jgi:hypothetical protein
MRAKCPDNLRSKYDILLLHIETLLEEALQAEAAENSSLSENEQP